MSNARHPASAGLFLPGSGPRHYHQIMADNVIAGLTASLNQAFSAMWRGVLDLWNYPISFIEAVGAFVFTLFVVYIAFRFFQLVIRLGKILWDLLQIPWLRTKQRLRRSSTHSSRKL